MGETPAILLYTKYPQIYQQAQLRPRLDPYAYPPAHLPVSVHVTYSLPEIREARTPSITSVQPLYNFRPSFISFPEELHAGRTITDCDLFGNKIHRHDSSILISDSY